MPQVVVPGTIQFRGTGIYTVYYDSTFIVAQCPNKNSKMSSVDTEPDTKRRPTDRGMKRRNET